MILVEPSYYVNSKHVNTVPKQHNGTRVTSKKAEKQLHKLYYEEKFQFGRDKMYEKAKDLGIKVSRRGTQDWLSKQEPYQLFVRKPKVPITKPTIAKGVFRQIGIDLIDFHRHEYGGYNWILTAYDMFSKMGFAVPMKGKQTDNIIEATQTLIDRIQGYGIPIGSFRSDRGSEFISDEFKKLLKKEDIKHVLSLAHKPWSNGAVEKWNDQLKRMIFKALYTAQSRNWVSMLPKLVHNYNTSKHFITQKKPVDIVNESQNENTITKENIEKKVKRKVQKQTKEFKRGDVVRIRLDKDTFRRAKNVWSKDLYVVMKKISGDSELSVASYIVSDVEGNELKHRFGQNDLLGINYEKLSKI